MSAIAGRIAVLLAAVLSAIGCSRFDQASDLAYVRQPGQRAYNAGEPVAATAGRLWEYAVFSENAYRNEWPGSGGSARSPMRVPEGDGVLYQAACKSPDQPLPVRQWARWESFPSPALVDEAEQQGLFVEAWERADGSEVTVVFRGTEFSSLRDWKANLRWFLRFLPFYQDQYTVVAEKVGAEFMQVLRQRAPSSRPSRIAVTGHSLGGGLAQHFAYSLPREPSGEAWPRVAQVFAFDPSPVTGWSSVDRALRSHNVASLETVRAFEHGEILAYLRLILGYVIPPSASAPAIRQVRYNFVRSGDVVGSHSMRLLACELLGAAGAADVRDGLKVLRSGTVK